MLEFDYETLCALGLTPALASRALATEAALDADEERCLRLVRVTEVHRETLAVHDGGSEGSARVRPRLFRAQSHGGDAMAAGDWALAEADAHGQRWIEARVPPTSHLVRRDAEGRRHTVVSNVDIALLVMGLDGDFNPRRLERYLALVQEQAIEPVVVLTKRDVATPDDASLSARLRALHGRVSADVPRVAVDATHPSAADALRDHIEPGRTLVLLGSSGAGKSTLTNSLLGTQVQATRAARESDGRGVHTTTSRSLHRLPGGACVIDTPGVRTLRPEGDGRALSASFTDVEALAGQCRFRDCRHEHEPGCAVRDGVDADRLRNYHKLLREMRRDTMSALDRERQLAQWKVRHRAARVRDRLRRDLGSKA